MAIVHQMLFGGIRVLQVDANPNGSITAEKGSVAMETSGGTLYQNTDGGTTWVEIATA